MNLIIETPDILNKINYKMPTNDNLKNANNKDNKNEFLLNLYGFLAILIVIIPEWIAETLITINNVNRYNKIPKKSIRWRIETELRLSTMTIRKLRIMAKRLRINGYASENRASLSKRINKKLEKHYSKK